MTTSLWVPIWMIALGAAHFFGPHWLFVSLTAVGSAHLSAIIAYVGGPGEHAGAISVQGYTLETLMGAVNGVEGETLPLCLGGVGVGIVPVTDWFTARIDGRTVVVLEHIEGVQ